MAAKKVVVKDESTVDKKEMTKENIRAEMLEYLMAS